MPTGPERVRRQEANGDAPTWIEDSEAPTCMGCQKSFGSMAWRHHCRVCMCVFCDTCAPFRTKGVPVSARNNDPKARYKYTSSQVETSQIKPEPCYIFQHAAPLIPKFTLSCSATIFILRFTLLTGEYATPVSTTFLSKTTPVAAVRPVGRLADRGRAGGTQTRLRACTCNMLMQEERRRGRLGCDG